jgi:amino acid adenylation domain-containing protein
MTKTSQTTDLTAAKAALLKRWKHGDMLLRAASAIRAGAAAGAAPLSLPQERIWFAEQFQPGTVAYNLFFCSRIQPPLVPALLDHSLADLAQRHSILRSTFRMHQGQPRQFIGAAVPRLEVEDLRALELDAALKEALTRVDAAIHTPLSLETGPLARMILYRLTGLDVLVLVVHHLVADGWSLSIAMRELSEMYLAHANGRKLALDPLPFQYSDFAHWQRERERAAHWAKDLAYWTRQLADLPSVSLPADHTRPAVLSHNGNWLEVSLSASLSTSLRHLAREEDGTLFMVLLTVLKILLYKMTGQADLTVGTAIANRAHAETFGLIGNFINMLALRTTLAGDPSFHELFQRVKKTCKEAFGRQQTPFERVVQELRPGRDLSRGVLFQTLFILQPPRAPVEFAGAVLEPIEIGLRTTHSDLELHLWDRARINGRIVYSTDLFDAATIASLAERFQTLLEVIVHDRSRRISEHSILLPVEKEALQVWSRGPERALSEYRVDRLIEWQSEAHGAATAVRFEETVLSYRELNQQANRLAHHLRALGVGPEIRVGICLDRSVRMIVALLAVLKSGGVYVPQDPSYPAELLAATLRHASASVVVTTTALAARLNVPGQLVCLDRDDMLLAGCPEHNPRVALSPENLAYIIYTSGSTGTPKGVQVTHQALANLSFSMLKWPGLQASDTQVCIASISFDASVAEIFPPLAAGATLVIASSSELGDGVRLAHLLKKHAATVLQATPTTWLLLQTGGCATGRKLRVLCGGEPASRELAESLVQEHETCWHMYGPTETTVWSSTLAMTPPGLLSLGRPIANTQLYVLDADLQPCALGVVGELCIGGIGLARGYLNEPAMTAEKFIPDPFNGSTGARLYRTGDMARYTRTGILEFVGRRDGQVKLRGHRIELGEIETMLCAHAAVQRAIVVLREFKQGDSRLIAYVTLKQAQEDGPIKEDLAFYLRQRLPAYMVPSRFVVLDNFPLMPTGKLDRRRLPAPERTREELEAAYVAPATVLERQLAALIAEYLEVERVGTTDDFFALGGHSLLAARIVHELRERYGIELMLQHLFLSPTVAQLAALIEQESARKRVLTSEEERLRRTVADLSEDRVDQLLGSLLAERRHDPPAPRGVKPT